MNDDTTVDHYKVLQVDSEADPEVVQAAFRRLAQKFHPDVAASAEAAARMVAINAAWEVLGDPGRRSAYDAARAGAREDPPPDVGGSRSTTGPVGTGRPDAGPPLGSPTGSRLNFGRYAGWTLGQVERTDLDYLEWLDRMPIGRTYRDELDAILRRTGRRRTAAEEATQRRGLFRRR